MKMLGALLLTLCVSFSALADDRFIVVGGSGEKSLDPNMVSLTVEIWSKAATAKQAQQMAATQYKSVKKAFDDFKIKKEDIQTDNYSLNPEYTYDQKTQTNRMTGFRVSQSLRVVIRKVDDAGNFLDALVSEKKSNDTGVNINSINWDSDQRAKAELAALGDAVKEAKLKAEEIAQAAGVKIKGVSKISHGAAPIQPPMPVFRAMKSFGGAAEMADSTQVSAGQIKVRVDVTAEYQIQ